MRVIESGIGEMIQPPDLDGFREWNREKKSRALVDKRMTEAEAISRFVTDGCYTGTESFPRSEISVYPNPVHEFITIRAANPEHLSVEITSANGQLIASTEMDGTILQLDLSSFRNGVYFIAIRSRDFLTTRKIVKL